MKKSVVFSTNALDVYSTEIKKTTKFLKGFGLKLTEEADNAEVFVILDTSGDWLEVYSKINPALYPALEKVVVIEVEMIDSEFSVINPEPLEVMPPKLPREEGESVFLVRQPMILSEDFYTNLDLDVDPEELLELLSHRTVALIDSQVTDENIKRLVELIGVNCKHLAIEIDLDTFYPETLIEALAERLSCDIDLVTRNCDLHNYRQDGLINRPLVLLYEEEVSFWELQNCSALDKSRLIATGLIRGPFKGAIQEFFKCGGHSALPLGYMSKDKGTLAEVAEFCKNTIKLDIELFDFNEDNQVTPDVTIDTERKRTLFITTQNISNDALKVCRKHNLEIYSVLYLNEGFTPRLEKQAYTSLCGIELVLIGTGYLETEERLLNFIKYLKECRKAEVQYCTYTGMLKQLGRDSSLLMDGIANEKVIKLIE